MNKPVDNQTQLFTIFQAYKKIGTCAYQIITDQRIGEENESPFPTSWCSNKIAKTIRPFLKITDLETMENKQAGNGRLCLQALFEVSKKYGCQGRMLVEADFGSGAFYEHCGFKAQKEESDCIKYFDPTKENLDLLYRGSAQSGDFKLIPLSVPKLEEEKYSTLDKELFNRMLVKEKQK